MFEGDMSEMALQSYEDDAEYIHTPARILRLVNQIRNHRKEIERQRALIEKLEGDLACSNASQNTLRSANRLMRALIERIKIPVRDYTKARHFTGCRCDMCEWLKDASGEVKDASKCLDKLK